MKQLQYKKMTDKDGSNYMIIYEAFRMNTPLLVLGPEQVDKFIATWRGKKE